MSKSKSLPKGIRQQKNGRYIVDVTVNGARKTATCASVDEALKTQLELRGVLPVTPAPVFVQNEGSNFKKTSWTIDKACDYILQTRWKSLSYIQNAKTMINAVKHFFHKNILLEDITTLAMTEFITHLKNKYAVGTAKVYFTGLITIMRCALECGGLDKLPVIPTVKSRSKRIRYFTHEEETRILNYFIAHKDSLMYDIIVCLFDTGMRCNELLHLKREDIDLKTNMISIWKNKTDKPRSIPMTKRVKEIILKQLDTIGIRGKLFNIRYSALICRWEKMRQELFQGENDCVPHTLRHTCCSRLIQKGASLPFVMAWMGHKNISTTMVYAHLAPDSLSSLVSLLE